MRIHLLSLSLGTERNIKSAAETRWSEGGQTPLYRRLPKWPEAYLARYKAERVGGGEERMMEEKTKNDHILYRDTNYMPPPLLLPGCRYIYIYIYLFAMRRCVCVRLKSLSVLLFCRMCCMLYVIWLYTYYTPLYVRHVHVCTYSMYILHVHTTCTYTVYTYEHTHRRC